MFDALNAKLTEVTKDSTDILNRTLIEIEDMIFKQADVISQMQLVLDSGTLVGEITPKIDQALGQRQTLADRGVY